MFLSILPLLPLIIAARSIQQKAYQQLSTGERQTLLERSRIAQFCLNYQESTAKTWTGRISDPWYGLAGWWSPISLANLLLATAQHWREWEGRLPKQADIKPNATVS